MTDCLEEMKEAVISGDTSRVQELTRVALDAGETPQTVLNEGLIPAMSIVGEKFQSGDFYLSEMMISARAMYGGLNIVKPLLSEQKVESKGKAVVGTVKGDLHDIGKNLVCMMLEGGGYEVVDLRVDVSPDQFVAAVEAHKPDFVMMSALLTTTMASMGKTIMALREHGLREQIQIAVGGAPMTQKFADSIGADFTASDAGEAVTKANAVLASM